MLMYRGIRPSESRIHSEFASDPGDYGQGEYWSNRRSFAEVYGEVIEREIDLESVYHIPSNELHELIESYRTCKIEDGRKQRLDGAKRLTEHFKSRGYSAVLTYGYESFGTYGLCIFDNQ